jgi:hypothetical protein
MKKVNPENLHFIAQPNQPTRECGTCSLCCKLIAVEELKKLHGVWCFLWKKGVGCKIYNIRPKSCKEFTCLWLEGKLPDELSPRRTGVLAYQLFGDKAILLAEDRPNLADKYFRRAIDHWYHLGIVVVISWQDKMKYLGENLGIIKALMAKVKTKQQLW